MAPTSSLISLTPRYSPTGSHLINNTFPNIPFVKGVPHAGRAAVREPAARSGRAARARRQKFVEEGSVTVRVFFFGHCPVRIYPFVTVGPTGRALQCTILVDSCGFLPGKLWCLWRRKAAGMARETMKTTMDEELRGQRALQRGRIRETLRCGKNNRKRKRSEKKNAFQGVGEGGCCVQPGNDWQSVAQTFFSPVSLSTAVCRFLFTSAAALSCTHLRC